MALDFTPKECKITVTRRDNPDIQFKFKYPEGHELEGEPIDLTGNSYVMTANYAVDGSGTELFSIAHSNSPGPSGIVVFSPSISDMTQDVGTYYFDVQQTDGAGIVRTLVKDTIEFLPDISA